MRHLVQWTCFTLPTFRRIRQTKFPLIVAVSSGNGFCLSELLLCAVLLLDDFVDLNSIYLLNVSFFKTERKNNPVKAHRADQRSSNCFSKHLTFTEFTEAGRDRADETSSSL